MEPGIPVRPTRSTCETTRAMLQWAFVSGVVLGLLVLLIVWMFRATPPPLGATLELTPWL